MEIWIYTKQKKSTGTGNYINTNILKLLIMWISLKDNLLFEQNDNSILCKMYDYNSPRARKREIDMYNCKILVICM